MRPLGRILLLFHPFQLEEKKYSKTEKLAFKNFGEGERGVKGVKGGGREGERKTGLTRFSTKIPRHVLFAPKKSKTKKKTNFRKRQKGLKYHEREKRACGFKVHAATSLGGYRSRSRRALIRSVVSWVSSLSFSLSISIPCSLALLLLLTLLFKKRISFPQSLQSSALCFVLYPCAFHRCRAVGYSCNYNAWTDHTAVPVESQPEERKRKRERVSESEYINVWREREPVKERELKERPRNSHGEMRDLFSSLLALWWTARGY